MKNKDEVMSKVMEFATKVQNNKYLSAISQGLMQTLPILMIGSFALLLAVLPIAIWKNLIISTGFQTYLFTAATLTTSTIALYAAFCIGYQLAKLYNHDGLVAGVISVFSFLMLTPLSEGAIDPAWLSAQGLFTAMIAALLSSRLYVLFIEKNVTIKMPDGVPPFVNRTFSSLVPTILVAAFTLVVSYLFSFTYYGSLAQYIYSVVALPLQGLTGSVWSLVCIVLIQMSLWLFGIHGSLVVGSFITALYLPLDTINMDALASGVANSELPNILGKSFYDIFAGIGGAGGTLSLVILMVILSKSKKNNTLGKLAMVPGCFTINEPVVFGYPLILDPFMAVPFIIVPLVQTMVAYLAMATGIVPRLSGVQVPFGMPVLVNGFIAGGWKVSVLQIVLVIIGIVIYYPFFIISDRQSCKEENTSSEVNV